MNLENQLQPNCSELGLILNAASVSKAVEDLRSAGLKVLVSYKEQEWLDLDPDTVQLFVTQFHASTRLAVDKAALFVAMARLPKKLGEALMHNADDDSDVPQVLVEYKGKCVQFQMGDYCGGGDNPTLQISDYDNEFYNVFYNLDKKGLAAEIYGIDGGHTDGYDDYKAKRQAKEEDEIWT